jgi:DNA adenine methylase
MLSRMSSPPSSDLRPFLKWAGGKRQLLPAILRLIPDHFETYHEPFLGGGAVFFALAAEGRFKRAVLGDQNRDLICCYQAIANDVESVIEELRRHPYDEAHYYKVRSRIPEKMSLHARAARTIYLNRAGFNGLYRVNQSGQFNVPFGSYKRPLICDEPRLRRVAEALQGVKVECRDFVDSAVEADRGDFVYFDPPYVPLSATSSFTAYSKDGFGLAEQTRLAATLRALGARGVPALLSNSDCPVTVDLYRGLPMERLVVRRSINSVGTGRGGVSELLVRSYEYETRRNKNEGRKRRAPSAFVAGSPRPKPVPALPASRRPRPAPVAPQRSS